VFELTPVEIVGYVASALIVASLAMSSVVRLRLLSLTGSVVFAAYALLIGSLPILLTNVTIAGINVWHLRRELFLRHDLGAVPIDVRAPFFADFIEYHLPDIRRFQPDAALPEADADVMAVLLMRDGLPAGVVVGRRDGTMLHVDIDYVIRPYRDARLGRWLFGPGSVVFRDAGVERLVTDPGEAWHRRYLVSMGFRPAGEAYELELSPPVR
jgi:hypothetical protein